jgi:hypothetical protein
MADAGVDSDVDARTKVRGCVGPVSDSPTARTQEEGATVAGGCDEDVVQRLVGETPAMTSASVHS